MSTLINKSDVLDRWAQQQVDGLDMKCMIQLCYDNVYEGLDKMTDSDIIEHISEFDPDFLEGEITDD